MRPSTPATAVARCSTTRGAVIGVNAAAAAERPGHRLRDPDRRGRRHHGRGPGQGRGRLGHHPAARAARASPSPAEDFPNSRHTGRPSWSIPALSPRSPTLLALLLFAVALVAAGCTPDGGEPLADVGRDDGRGTDRGAGTDRARPTGQPAPSDDGATAGEPDPSATVAADPDRDTDPQHPRPPRPSPKPFAMNLYRKRRLRRPVHLRVVRRGEPADGPQHGHGRHDGRPARTSSGLWEMARDTSFSPFGGANPRGWTATLNDLGIGPYELVSLPTLRGGPGRRRRGHPRHEAAGRPGHVAWPARLGDERLRVDRRPARVRRIRRHRHPRPRSAVSARQLRVGQESQAEHASSRPRPWPSSSSCATAPGSISACRPATCWCCPSPRLDPAVVTGSRPATTVAR